MRVRVLGRLEVSIDADIKLALGGPKQRTVLAMLLARSGRLVTVEQLINELWPEGPPKSAVANVRTYAANLRRLFRATDIPSLRLESCGPGYVAQVDREQFDMTIFRERFRQGREELNREDFAAATMSLGAAMHLWRGQPFEDVPIGPALTARRAALCDEHAVAAENHAEALLGCDGEHTAVAVLRDHVDNHPHRERGWELLMRALHRSGDVAGALAAYSAARQRLVEELGIEPGASLQALHRVVLSGQRPPPAPRIAGPRPPAQLPLDPYGFVGRDDEVARLDTILATAAEQPTAVVISAVWGTAGVGKTALAVHWAHRVADRFPDGQLYVNLRGFDPSGTVTTPAEAVRRFLDALGVSPERIPAGLDAQAALYRTLLSGKRVLVVLDNARDIHQIRPLLPGAPGSLVVITSRNQLTSLVAAEGAHPVPLDLFTPADAHALLVRRLGAERVAGEPAALDEIIARCARLPLALAVVAARAAAHPALPLADVAGELGGGSDRLDALTTGDPITDVRAVLSASYQALTAGAARLFRLLGLGCYELSGQGIY